MTDPYKDFCCSYRHDGTEWGLVIRAKNWNDAAQRLHAIGLNGEVDGELIATVPNVPGAGFFVRAMCALKVEPRWFWYGIAFGAAFGGALVAFA